jgi:hypothetical protein
MLSYAEEEEEGIGEGRIACSLCDDVTPCFVVIVVSDI